MFTGLATALALASLSPLQAQSTLEMFNRDDSGIRGCQGQAAQRGANPWAPRVYATWALGEGMVVMRDGQRLRSSAYQRRDAGNRTSMWWKVPGSRVELTFTTQRSGYETSAGDGTLRLFSGISGDSISIPVRVDEGC